MATIEEHSNNVVVAYEFMWSRGISPRTVMGIKVLADAEHRDAAPDPFFEMDVERGLKMVVQWWSERKGDENTRMKWEIPTTLQTCAHSIAKRLLSVMDATPEIQYADARLQGCTFARCCSTKSCHHPFALCLVKK